MIQVVLTKAVPKLGRRGEVKKVKDGYFRNFLYPRSMAVVATPGRLKEAEGRMAKMSMEMDQIRAKMKDVLAKLEASTLVFQKKATAAGKLYASISAKQVSEALETQLQLSLPPSAVVLDEPLKTVGMSTITLKLADNFSAPLKVEIQALAK